MFENKQLTAEEYKKKLDEVMNTKKSDESKWDCQ